MGKGELMGKIMDTKELQNYQDIFCEAQRVFLTYYDKSGQKVTMLSGRNEEIRNLYAFIGKEELSEIIDKAVSEARDSADPVWKDTIYENVKVVGIGNNLYGNNDGTWALVVVYREDLYNDEKNIFPTKGLYDKVTFNGANRTIRLLQIFTKLFITAAYDNNRTIMKLNEITEKDSRITEELKHKETVTKILGILDKDLDIEGIIQAIIDAIADYLDISMITVSKVRENSLIEVIGKWHSNDFGDYEEVEKHILPDIIPYYNGESILIIEPDTDDEELKQILQNNGLRSLISVPIIVGKEPAIYAVFAESRYDRFWDSNTVRFLFDVCKMIQSFLYKRIAKNSLISSYAALKEILNNLGSGIFVINKSDNRILFCNDTMMKMAGRDLVGEHCYDYYYGCKGDCCKECIPLKNNTYYIEKYDEKRQRWYDIKYNDIIWVDGSEVSLCNITDVTDKKNYQQRIEFQANNDFLTGLYNRMRCEEDLILLIRETEKSHKQGIILFIDLDDFKHINDGLGHQYGDELLKMISMSFRQIKEISNRCYRVGGDEFIIIIEPGFYDKRDRIISEIQKIFASPWYLENAEYYCTMSMGIVEFPSCGKNVNDLIKKADIAMYDAKKNGKNRYRYYSDGEDENSYIKLDIEKNMRSSVAAGCKEFEVYIQPIMDTATEKCVGGEALVRWNSNKLGFMMPGEFIPLAEHMGLITPIGEHVLKNSCMLSKKWSDMGINLRINVNLSVVQLLANNIVEVISEVIEETQINPENLVLEVTESLAINDMERMERIISEIKKLGVKIALDDFGTGYSSLNYIKQMDLDIIKVDRTFIKDISHDDYAQAFVKLIAELSQKLEVQVCVEGVEEKSQLDTLKSMNISMVQGYYYGKPMKIEEFEKRFLNI